MRGKEGLAAGIFKMSHREIAEALHLNADTVADIERRVLLKIRKSPELQELWRNFIEDGCPVPLPESENHSAMALLDYQLSVADWWSLHDKIVAYGGTDEAVECLREIAQFQERIGKFLEKVW